MLANAHVQLQGAFPSKFVILNVRYLMLEHNPTISKVRPCLLQHVVRPLQRLLVGLRAYGLCTGPGQATSSSGD